MVPRSSQRNCINNNNNISSFAPVPHGRVDRCTTRRASYFSPHRWCDDDDHVLTVCCHFFHPWNIARKQAGCEQKCISMGEDRTTRNNEIIPGSGHGCGIPYQSVRKMVRTSCGIPYISQSPSEWLFCAQQTNMVHPVKFRHHFPICFEVVNNLSWTTERPLGAMEYTV